jgi:hypothetical protein|tara:strand:+ start:7291 stop:8316 length:1026 start_codon:yes stop_codon:yes gene_type:complete
MKLGSVFALLLMSWTVYAQNHFESVDSTGLPYQVIILTDSIMGYQLQNGDEIGLFSDTLCVGSDIYNGSGNFPVTAWEGSDQYNLPGFVDGDSIRIFIWVDLGDGVDEYEVAPIFITGDGTFGFGSYSSCFFTITTLEPILEVSETEHDFGDVEIGLESDTWSFIIKNIGQATLEFEISLQEESVFTLSNYTISSLEPQDSLFVGVNFIPQALGIYTDTVYISSSAPENGTAEIILHGTGTDTSTSSVGDDNIPLSHHLGQNYPNPFNPSTEIPFYITTKSYVNLIVYNIYGQEMEVLIDGIRDAGNYLIRWNAEDFASGVYYIKLVVNGKIFTRQGILLK